MSHVGTQQWQSFEMRMRYRRAERCLLRADVALEAGFPQDAREALEEARALAPHLAGIAEIEERLAKASPVVTENVVAEPPSRSHWRANPIAALAAACLMLVSIGLWSGSGERTTESVQSSASAVATPIAESAAAAPARTPEAPAPAPRVDVGVDEIQVPVVRVDRVEEKPVERKAADETRAERTTAAERVPETTRTTLPATNVARSTTSEPSSAPVPSIGTSGTTPAPPVVASAPPLLPVAPPPAAAIPPPAPAPAPAPASEAPAAAAASGVRNVLSRYESAYSRLDANAAQSVYPSLNARALSRAFENLSSQRVSLGDCSVNVEGSTARARCAGSATWTPKIGGGSRTESRQWNFTLRQRGDDWEIIQATVR